MNIPIDILYLGIFGLSVIAGFIFDKITVITLMLISLCVLLIVI